MLRNNTRAAKTFREGAASVLLEDLLEAELGHTLCWREQGGNNHC